MPQNKLTVDALLEALVAREMKLQSPAGADRRQMPLDRQGSPVGWETAGPNEEFYRARANSIMGGDVYGPLKGEGWDRKIPAAAADMIRRPEHTGESEAEAALRELLLRQGRGKSAPSRPYTPRRWPGRE